VPPPRSFSCWNPPPHSSCSWHTAPQVSVFVLLY
jgi:hypothetical protein